MSPDAVVVGGGVAGLVAARILARGGLDVVLVERSDRLGGTVTHHVVGGLVLDAGAESFATRGGTVDALATELGLGPDVVVPSGLGAWLQADDRALPLPATSVLGIPGVPLAEDVVAVVGRRAAYRAFAETLLPGTYGSRARTLGELVRRRMGSAMLEGLVAPVTYGVHSAHPDDLELDRVVPGLRFALLRENSLARAVQTLRERAPAGSQVAGIRGGVHRLVDELEADLVTYGVDVRLGATFDAADFPDARLVQAAPPEEIATRVVLATLVVDAPELDAHPRGTGVLVKPGSAGIAAKALTHATAKWPWLAERAGAGRHVLRLSYAVAPGLFGDAGFCATALHDANRLLGTAIPESAVVDSARVEWTRAAPRTAFDDDVVYVGEADSGTGLANVVRHATERALALLAELTAEDTATAENEGDPA